MTLYIGTISGTSIDGIDVALVNFDNNQLAVIGTHNEPYSDQIVNTLNALRLKSQLSLNEFGELNNQLGLAFADAINNLLAKVTINSSEIEAIGSHGQTIFHHPHNHNAKHFTLQLGNPNLIAAQTGIKTIADFRGMDMAYGGQGAPLAPAFHQTYFSSNEENRIILNIGGIANLTCLSDDKTNPAIAFDSGPGNTLMDAWMQQQFNQNFDENGLCARAGQVNTALLNTMLTDEYFKRPAPKSTGFEYFNLAWLSQYASPLGDITPQDMQATLLALTAHSIQHAILELINFDEQKVSLYLCGGGAHNDYLLESLCTILPEISIASTESLGLAPDWVEAVTFAWLAKMRNEARPIDTPTFTGSTQPVILGGEYLP